MTVATLPATSPERHYIVMGRAALSTRLPDEAFEALTWSTRALRKKSGQLCPMLYFTEHASTTDALPARYQDVIKAWIAQKTKETPSRMGQRVSAVRWLWRAIDERLGGNGAALFQWSGLQMADFQRAEQLLIDDGCKSTTIYRTAGTMGELAKDLSGAGIIAPLRFKPKTKRKGDSSNHRLDAAESRAEGVLSTAALHAVADIFAHASRPDDIVYSALLTIMIAAGIRWNEAVCIPLDALEDEAYDSRDVAGRLTRRSRTYLRYFKAKSNLAGGEGVPSFERVALSAGQAALCRLAVDRLATCCADARTVAAQLEGMDRRWRWPGSTRPEYVWAKDLAQLLGCGIDNAQGILRKWGEPDPAHSGAGRPSRRMSVSAFERYMTSRMEWDKLWTVVPHGAHPGLRASQALTCLRENELHGVRGTLPLIDEASHAGLERWLEGLEEGEHLSVFRRHERDRGVRYVEPDGTLVMINSHMCRRLFVTNAYAAGATTLDLMRWQGREHVGDLATYDRRSMVERATSIKSHIQSGRLRGQVAQAYVQIAEDERDEWLEGQVAAMHVTPLGLCVHDFSVTPCPRALNCLKDCPDYLHDPNDAGQRAQLVQLQRRTSAVLTKMQPEVATGHIAPSWVDEHRRTLANVERILATPASPDGAYIRPFADAPTRFQPLRPES